MIYDVAVIGGGPAGATCAGFLAQRGLKVAVFEKERFPRYHIGESLVPVTTLGIMKLLGVSEKIDSAGFPKKYGGSFRWGAQEEPWSLLFYRRNDVDKGLGDHPDFLNAYQVKREVFDKILLDHAAQCGAEVFEQFACNSMQGLDDRVKVLELSDLSTGQTQHVTARYVVDASGRASPLSNVIGKRHYDPLFENIAVFRYFDHGGRFDGVRQGNIFCSAFEHGWFWYIPLTNDDQRLTSVGLVMSKKRFNEARRDQDTEQLLESMIQANADIRDLLRDAVPCRTAPYDRVRTEADYSYCNDVFAKKGVFLAGDAACFIDPVFSSGVHLATYAGYLAAEAIGEIEGGAADMQTGCEKYDQCYRREYNVFHTFLTSFYNINKELNSYYWDARKILRQENEELLRLDESFIKIVSGMSTVGEAVHDGMAQSIEEASAAIKTYIGLRNGREHEVSDHERQLAQMYFSEFGATPRFIYEQASDLGTQQQAQVKE